MVKTIRELGYDVNEKNLKFTYDSFYYASGQYYMTQIINFMRREYDRHRRKVAPVITDATANIGASSTGLATWAARVNAVEIDAYVFGALANNIWACGLQSVVTPVLGDYNIVGPTLKEDILFLDPVWAGPTEDASVEGGPQFAERQYELPPSLGALELHDVVLAALRRGTNYIFCKVPPQTQFDKFDTAIRQEYSAIKIIRKPIHKIIMCAIINE